MHCRRPQQSGMRSPRGNTGHYNKEFAVRLWQDQREPLREHPSPTGIWDCRDNLETIFSQVEAVLLQTRHPHPLELNSITFLQETPDALIHRISALEIVLAETKGNAGNSSLPFV